MGAAYFSIRQSGLRLELKVTLRSAATENPPGSLRGLLYLATHRIGKQDEISSCGGVVRSTGKEGQSFKVDDGRCKCLNRKVLLQQKKKTKKGRCRQQQQQI